MTISPDVTPQFALARADDSGLPRYARLRGKLSRFLARNVVTKRLALRNAEPLVTFTFDDAPASACGTGARLLEEYRARGTYYISGGGCGNTGPCGSLATVEQVKALYTNGHEIGCHTYSHNVVAGVDHDTLAAEIERNRSFLQGIHRDMSVRNFAYPHGDLSFSAKRYLERHFDSCRSIRSGVNVGTADLGALKTCALQSSEIDRKGVLEVLAATARQNGWLIFTSHDVEDEPSPFGVSPDLFSFALKTAHEAGCRLVTVGDALQILRSAAA